VVAPGVQLIIAELNRYSIWAALRRLKDLAGANKWRDARFRSQQELSVLLERNGFSVECIRGAIYYPPAGFFAQLFSFLDPALSKAGLPGAAFLAAKAIAG
jgi:hypothetical protein